MSCLATLDSLTSASTIDSRRRARHSLVCLVCVVFVVGCRPPTPTQESTGDGWQLVWSDEFDYDGLPDSSKWSYAVGDHGWGNDELQFYTDGRLENASVADGSLRITAVREEFSGRQFTSARLRTHGKGDWQYGRIEVRAKLPEAVGTWPAIWMMPSGWEFSDGGWPRIGEIDIMEHVGFDPGVIHASVHTEKYYWRIGTQRTDTIRVDDPFGEFHVYALEWTANELRAYVDGEEFFKFENEGLGPPTWPFDKPFSLILNIAVGGAWGGQQGVDDNAFPQIMEVDYVRVFQ